tara:strand:- start:874 stop:1353 length:480 start_codon:yes stop_codon:yes gene_type:complete
MTSKYIKHLIECHCTLKIFEKRTKPLYHKFPVFSVFDNDDNLEEKYVACNNCNVIHRVYGVCKSEIKWGNEGYSSLVCTKEDVIFNLNNNNKEKVVELLTVNDLELADWELVDYLIENEEEGYIVLDKKELDNNINYKVLYIHKDGKIKVKNKLEQRYL